MILSDVFKMSRSSLGNGLSFLETFLALVGLLGLDALEVGFFLAAFAGFLGFDDLGGGFDPGDATLVGFLEAFSGLLEFDTLEGGFDPGDATMVGFLAAFSGLCCVWF